MCMRSGGRSAPPSSRKARASWVERSISSAACAKSIGAIESGQGGHDDQLRVVAVKLDVGDQAAVREQAERVQRHTECASGRALQCARVSGGQHVDLAGAELDGV
jgi:hypothetical protein